MTGDMAARIKDRLTIREVCERYGLHFNNNGLALCPFHEDHHPSANIKEKDQSFHCSVCGIHGDVFTFTMRMFNINFRQAMVRLNEDFGLGITSERPDPRKVEEWKRKKAVEEAALQAYREEYDRNTALYRYIWRAMKLCGSVKNERQARRRAAWVAEIEYLNCYFETHHWK